MQAGKDMTYLVVILAGFALTGFLFWSVGSEFLASNSPSAIFTQALKRVKNDPRVSTYHSPCMYTMESPNNEQVGATEIVLYREIRGHLIHKDHLIHYGGTATSVI